MTTRKLTLRERAAEALLPPRIKFFQLLTDYVEWVTTHVKGAVLLHSTRLSEQATHTIRELRNFRSFTFRSERCQSPDKKGNRCTIWYHPGREGPDGLSPVLDIWWPEVISEDTCTTRVYIRDDWRSQLLVLIRLWKEAPDSSLGPDSDEMAENAG
jgi:hypothetical protein